MKLNLMLIRISRISNVNFKRGSCSALKFTSFKRKNIVHLFRLMWGATVLVQVMTITIPVKPVEDENSGSTHPGVKGRDSLNKSQWLMVSIFQEANANFFYWRLTQRYNFQKINLFIQILFQNDYFDAPNSLRSVQRYLASCLYEIADLVYIYKCYLQV